MHNISVPILTKPYTGELSGDVEAFIEIMDNIALSSTTEWSFVGGYARDLALGFEPNDFDVCTSVNHRFRDVMVEMGVLEIGQEVHHRERPHDYFMNPYSFDRRKYPMHWIEADEQAAFAPTRFDFTINHFAFKSDRKFYAPKYAWTDLFVEKILRVSPELTSATTNILLRGIRFANKYNLSIEPRTWEMMLKRIEQANDKKYPVAMGNDLIIKHLKKMQDDGVEEKCMTTMKELQFPDTDKVNTISELISHHTELIVTGRAQMEAGRAGYDE